ncbi:MAG: hypothetical protein PV353_12040, partial [Bartonella sp.]|nr:hypothetical protein [Bartonella sp.]
NQEILDVKNSILVTQEDEINLFRIDESGLHLGKLAGVINIGKGSGGSEISVLNKDNAKRKISGLAPGNLSVNSSDAVNGSQLYSMNDKIATYFGGGSSFNGTFTGPTYKLSQIAVDGTVKRAQFSDVGSAFTGLDTNVKNVNTHLTNEVKKFDQKITNITEKIQGDALLWSDKDHAFVATHGNIKG